MSPPENNLCVKVTFRYVFTKTFLLFTVSHKIDLLNQLCAMDFSSTNQRTLDLIRDDLISSSIGESEGTFWDSHHPHLFVVMGASVSRLELIVVYVMPDSIDLVC